MIEVVREMSKLLDLVALLSERLDTQTLRLKILKERVNQLEEKDGRDLQEANSGVS